MLALDPMRKDATTDLQIRRIPQRLVEELRARSRKKGKTMSEYAIDLLEQDLSRPTLDEVLDRIRRHRIPVHGDMTGAQAVREAREERAEQLASAAAERLRRSQR